MKQYTNGFVRNRILKINVGFLLSDGPSHIHDTEFDVPAIRVAEDIDAAYIRGGLRMSRTKEGILLQGTLHVGIETECGRCLDPVLADLLIPVEELFNHPARDDGGFNVGEDSSIDLAPLLREETLIAEGRGALCKDDCQGICPQCGANRNHTHCDCHLDVIDPRMAKLKDLLGRS